MQNDSEPNTLINLQKINNTESSVCINCERTYLNHIIEELLYNENTAEIIDHACGDSGINLVNTEEEVYVPCINHTNETNDISNNNDVECFIYIMHLLITK